MTLVITVIVTVAVWYKVAAFYLSVCDGRIPLLIPTAPHPPLGRMVYFRDEFDSKLAQFPSRNPSAADGLGHSLTTLSVQLELIQRLTQQEPVAAAGALATAQKLTHRCLQDVRLSVQTMRHSQFDLNQAIRELIEQMRALHPLTINHQL
ncbi:hypothetical protein C7271_17795 [filamentous cyanobacterium CCP5]|nr:hypothetical protein C7271_17795 [filamentous cyanobacterium CCP5]